MVCATEYPNFRAASCCKVDVVKGGAGDFFAGRTEISSIVKFACWQASRKFKASSLVFSRLFNSAFNSIGFPFSDGIKNVAIIRYEASEIKFFISFSRSTIRRTATDCTRPADNAGFTFFHSTGESSNPTMRSRTRRACCASTLLISIARGFSIALRMADWVIS
ncbi:unknown [Tannerella sp. CAG:118]|nr:unknown [Tannerella sp. CAG:118]